MIDSILINYEEILLEITNRKLYLLANYLNSMKNCIQDLHSFLKPFHSFTEILGKENEPTLNIVIPAYYKMIELCMPLMSDSEFILDKKKKMKKLLKKHVVLNDLHFFATILTPKYKTMVFLEEEEMQYYYAKLEKYLEDLSEETDPENTNKIQKNLNNKDINKNLLSNYEIVSDDEKKDITELKRYLEQKIIIGDELKYWSQYKDEFLNLYKLFNHLIISASEFSCKRIFSIVSYLINARNSHLTPNNIMHRSFIKFNNFIY